LRASLTGNIGDEASLRGQIESLIPRTLPLFLSSLWLNEFMSIQNIDPSCSASMSRTVPRQ
jgi:hypothetical protein